MHRDSAETGVLLGYDLPAPCRHGVLVLPASILDLFSRKFVDWEAHESDDSQHAAHLARRTALVERIAMLQTKPVLYRDNGSTLKATTVLAILNGLGVNPSYSRPRVSDENAYSESLFRNAKYRPEFPTKGFTDLDAARAWAADFDPWYNVDHRHSSIATLAQPTSHRRRQGDPRRRSSRSP